MKPSYAAPLLVLLALCTATSPKAAEAHDLEERFYCAIGNGDVDTALRMLHPAVLEKVDRPVFAVWIDALNTNLGHHRSVTSHSSSRTHRLTGTRIELTSTVTFEQGTAEASITILEGKVIAFQIQSDKMKNWFQGPEDVAQYAETAETFIAKFVAGDVAEARTLMHPVLQDAVAENFDSMVHQISDHSGKLKTATLREHRFSLDGLSPALFLLYDLNCENAQGTCEIEFQFVGLKGYLLGFDYQ
jgi:hypothetical protein